MKARSAFFPIALSLLFAAVLPSFAAEIEGKASKWHGFERRDFVHDGLKCIVISPKSEAKGRPWVWRARFFGHQPQADIALLKIGFHICYCEVGGLFGNDEAVERWNRFHALLAGEHGFSSKPALEGMSRGGLIIYNWAAANPGKVACIYGDAPVCDIRSWPGGKGKGKGGGGAWNGALKAHGITEGESVDAPVSPIHKLAAIAKAKIPLLHVVGAADTVVPVEENSAVIVKRYRKLGGDIKVISKPGVGHHPHALKDPGPIVDFIRQHTPGL
jgi:pimeloyl-ACP methyl ester carboxylesterase